MVEKYLKDINKKELFSELKIIIKKIINYSFENNYIDKKYENCVYQFYKTGSVCEDELLSNYRTKSFIAIILQTILSLYNSNNQEKKLLLITVGRYHVKYIYYLLSKLNINIKKNIFK